MAQKKWDPASTSRRIRFYLDHKDTPDDQMSGETIVNMWKGRQDHEQDPPALGSCWQCRQNHLLEFCDEQGVLTSKQGHVKEGTMLEVINFRDWNKYQDTLVRIRTGIHTGKHLRMRGAELSHLPSIPLEKVPPLQQAIEDARPKKTKPKGKSTGNGGHPVVEPPADAPIWVLKDNATKVQLVKPFNGVFKFENNKADLFLHERVKVCCEHNDQTVCQVVMPHGFRLFRVSIASFREHFTLEKHPQPEAAQEARTEGQQASQESEHVQHQPAPEPEPVISEAVKEALAFLESYLSVIWSIENPTENEYLLLGAKLDKVIQAMDDLWDRVPDATAQDKVIDAEVIECSTETPS
jgi:hypothetical protein